MERNYRLTLSASAGTMDLLVKMFEDLVEELASIEYEMTHPSSRGFKLPHTVELEGDAEYIRGVLVHHEADTDVPLGLDADDAPLAGYDAVRLYLLSQYMDAQQRVRDGGGALARRQLKAASAADVELSKIGKALGVIKEEPAEALAL